MDHLRLRSFPKELAQQSTVPAGNRDNSADRRAKESAIEKPSSQTIAVRLPDSLLEEIKELARRKEVGFHNLIKTMLMDQLAEEQKKFS